MVDNIISSIQDVARNEKVAVTATSKIIAEPRVSTNPRRLILIRNISSAAADVITVNLGLQQATAQTGIVLNQNESFVDATDAGYQCHQGTITAICATANGQIAILER